MDLCSKTDRPVVLSQRIPHDSQDCDSHTCDLKLLISPKGDLPPISTDWLSGASWHTRILQVLQRVNVNVSKQFCYTLWRRLERRYSSYSFTTSALDGGWVVSVMPQPRFTAGENTTGTHCTGGWVGPRASLDARSQRENPLLLLGIEPWSLGRPVHGQTLYCLSYPSSRLMWMQVKKKGSTLAVPM
jgi:hypothetical protein